MDCNVSRELVEGITQAGNGTALFTSLEEGLGEKVIHQLRDVFRPSWTGKLRFEINLNDYTLKY